MEHIIYYYTLAQKITLQHFPSHDLFFLIWRVLPYLLLNKTSKPNQGLITLSLISTAYSRFHKLACSGQGCDSCFFTLVKLYMLEKALALLFADTELAGEQAMPVWNQEVSTGFGFGCFCSGFVFTSAWVYSVRRLVDIISIATTKSPWIINKQIWLCNLLQKLNKVWLLCISRSNLDQKTSGQIKKKVLHYHQVVKTLFFNINLYSAHFTLWVPGMSCFKRGKIA